jgi:hypothetical protein
VWSLSLVEVALDVRWEGALSSSVTTSWPSGRAALATEWVPLKRSRMRDWVGLVSYGKTRKGGASVSR